MGEPGVVGKIILKWVLTRIEIEVLDWIHLAQDRSQ
jgi:hypothetical protein